jgi:hypothetical protein
VREQEIQLDCPTKALLRPPARLPDKIASPAISRFCPFLGPNFKASDRGMWPFLPISISSGPAEKYGFDITVNLVRKTLFTSSNASFQKNYSNFNFFERRTKENVW